ncbi:uncharacterized protein LOC128670167 [Plodia interpunctella]|uniref:uncharacterized protein LOC128670167 n=1 Tax=Plodia interpunctella TaxID=58824 RepID=UPI002368686D|nr:uncharacterized protein LOC128670167 [Plodia interpunctella]XP_053601592.1 uncharacterized protein LOC128670167 [Plodia interpunctella]
MLSLLLLTIVADTSTGLKRIEFQNQVSYGNDGLTISKTTNHLHTILETQYTQNPKWVWDKPVSPSDDDQEYNDDDKYDEDNQYDDDSRYDDDSQYDDDQPGQVSKDLKYIPPERVLKISLALWDKIEGRLQDLISSAVKISKRGIKDLSTRSVDVMFTVVKLATQLAQDCLLEEYARPYRQIVRSSLVEAERSPQVPIYLVSKMLNSISRNTEQIRELLHMPNGKPITDLRKLEREKNLVIALGILAVGAFSSYPLKKAIRDDGITQYMMSPNAEDELYPLVVKTALVLQLVSNRQTCELDLVGRNQLDDDDEESYDDSSFEAGA